MYEARQIDVSYADGKWMAEVGFLLIDSASLMHLITGVQRVLPGTELIFIVNRTMIKGNADAETQVSVARENSGAFVIWSTEC